MRVAPLVMVIAASALAAQNPAAPRFEAASIKLADSQFNGGIADAKFFPERFVATNVTLRQLIMEAYELEDREIVGAPAWVGGSSAVLFDVTAVVSGPVSVATMKTMLQALLIDRFQLQLERTTRSGTVYRLTAGRTRGLRPPHAPDERSVVALIPDDRGGVYKLHYDGHNASMDTLALTLEQLLRTPVVNNTNLKGSFDFQIAFAPTQTPPGIAADPNAPSIFTALELELGLKLVKGRGAIHETAIRHASMPSQN